MQHTAHKCCRSFLFQHALCFVGARARSQLNLCCVVCLIHHAHAHIKICLTLRLILPRCFAQRPHCTANVRMHTRCIINFHVRIARVRTLRWFFFSFVIFSAARDFYKYSVDYVYLIADKRVYNLIALCLCDMFLFWRRRAAKCPKARGKNAFSSKYYSEVCVAYFDRARTAIIIIIIEPERPSVHLCRQLLSIKREYNVAKRARVSFRYIILDLI